MPDRPDLLLLEVSECRAWRQHCDFAAFDARLRTLAPNNGVGWLDALASAVKAKDSVAIDAALGAIAGTSRVDIYWTRLTAHLAGVLHRIGGEDYSTALAQVDGNGILGGGMWLGGLESFGSACNVHAQLTSRRLNLCRNASVAFEQGDTLIAASIGSGIAFQVWPLGTFEHHRAESLRRRLDYMESQSGKLMSPPGRRLQTALELVEGTYWSRIVRWNAQHSREQGVLRTQLRHAGLDPDPPSNWSDPYP